MARVFAERVRESTNTVGTEDFVLEGAYTGYRSFDDVMADGDTCYYVAQPFVGDEWECGLGTYDYDENVLARTTVISSSNADAAVPFLPGVKNVFMAPLASRTAHTSGAFTATRIPYVNSNGELTDSSDLVRNSDGGLIVSATATAYSASIRASFIGSSSVTSSTTHVVVIGLNSTGTPAAGFGSRTEWWLETTTTEDVTAARIDVQWQTATHASRAADWVLYTFSTTSAQEGIRQRSNSGGVQLGFYGVTPVARASSTADLKDAICNIGIVTNGGATPLNLDDGALTCGDIVCTDMNCTETDAVTNAVTGGIIVGHNSSGTPAAGFGTDIVFNLETSTTADTPAASITAIWVTATHASRAARVLFYAYDTTARECMRIEASGSAAMIGFYGSAAIAQPSSTGETTGHTAGASTAVRQDSTFTGNSGTKAYTVGDIVKHLKALGLLATS